MNVIAVKNHWYCRKKSIVHNNWILRSYHSHANYCGFWSQCSRSTECSTFWLMMYFNLYNILPQYTLHSHKVFPCKWVAFMGSLLWKYSVLLLLCLSHQQKNIPFGRNGSVRVDALRQSSQRHPGGGLLCARRQYNVSRCISPSDRCFTVSSRSVGLLI
jgi:hypothetical protein